MCKIKNIILIFVVVGIHASTYAQEISQIDTSGFHAFLKLMYRTNPALEMKAAEIHRQEENVFQNKLSFLRNFRLGLQFNQTNTLDAQNTLGLVPKFGLNIQIDFESIFTTHSKIRQAKQEHYAAELDYWQTHASLKKELFTRYTNFQKSIQSYEIQLEKYRTIQELYLIAQKKFTSGEISLDEYSSIVEENATAHENLLTAELNIYTSKASLMELIDNQHGPYKSYTNP